MNEKIKIFIIGILVGAVVSTGAFYIYTLTTTNNCSNNQMMGGTPPELPSGENMTPPEKPNGENPKEMPSNNTQNNN